MRFFNEAGSALTIDDCAAGSKSKSEEVNKVRFQVRGILAQMAQFGATAWARFFCGRMDLLVARQVRW